MLDRLCAGLADEKWGGSCAYGCGDANAGSKMDAATDPAEQAEMYKQALRRVALESRVIILSFLSCSFSIEKT
jgi:hypothetical protein